MSVRDARANFADVLGSVYHTGEPVIVERNGKAVAVLVSPEAFARSSEPLVKVDDARLAELLARAPTVRALHERPARKPTGLSTREMIALAHEESWRRRDG